MMKKAKRTKPNGEPVYYLILKLLMIVPFAYSGFFYGGVTIVGIMGKYIEPVPPKWVLWAMAAGVVVMFAGILFAFFKKYIVSFILSLGGMISFLKAGGYLIKRIQDKLSNSAVDQSLQNMDKEYMWRFYPIIGVAVISATLLICTIIRKLIERKDCKERGITLLLRALSTDFGLRFCVNVRFCNILLTLCHKMI